MKAEDDTGPASVVPALYIDNYAAFSIDKSAARQAAGGMKQSLLDYGILSSFDPEADQVYLGFKLTRNEWRPTETKFWRVERSAQHVVFGNASFTGEEIEHFLGHCTHLLGLKNSMLSCIGVLYTFVQQSYRKRQPLWPSARREAKWIWSLLPLCTARVDSQWSRVVHCYDASLSGLGVVSSTWPLQDVRKHGRGFVAS